MEKIGKRDNALIKRKNLILKIRGAGIKRISPGAVLLIEKGLEKNLNNIIGMLKEKIIIKGRKTVKKQDVKECLSESKEEFLEI